MWLIFIKETRKKLNLHRMFCNYGLSRRYTFLIVSKQQITVRIQVYCTFMIQNKATTNKFIFSQDRTGMISLDFCFLFFMGHSLCFGGKVGCTMSHVMRNNELISPRRLKAICALLNYVSSCQSCEGYFLEALICLAVDNAIQCNS